MKPICLQLKIDGMMSGFLRSNNTA